MFLVALAFVLSKYETESEAHMLIQEILSSPYEYTGARRNEEQYCASFKAGDRMIHVDLYKLPRAGEHWELTFEERKEGQPGSLGITGSGDEFKVFSTVVEIVKKFITTNPVDSLTFTAEKTQGNRSRLYQRMVDRLLMPGWVKEVDKSSSDYRTYFTIKKEKKAA